MLSSLLPKPLRGELHRRRFFRTHEWRNLHWGVFSSFQAANAFSLQHGASPHYELDHRRWLADRQQLFPHDYPMLFWLQYLFDSHEGQQFERVCDLGGSVGVSYLALGPYLNLPPQLVWQVCELPDVVELGRQIASERGIEKQLCFSTEVDEALEGADVLFTAGAIQFIETPLEKMLCGRANAPRHILINRLPLTNGATFVTLQNTGMAVHPYRIRNDDEFVQALSQLGYSVVDRWLCLQNSTHIPLHPECTLQHFHGLYLRREGSRPVS